MRYTIEPMKCSELMTPNPMMCTPGDNVAAAINIMWDYDCGAVPVVKDLTSNELVGVVTDRDIAMHVVRHANVHPSQARVGDCMATAVVACQVEDSVEKVIQLMGEHLIRRIPVVDPNNICVGIISQADLLSRVAANMEAIVALLQQVSIPHPKPQASAVETAAAGEASATEQAEVAETPAATEKAEVAEESAVATDKAAAPEETPTAPEQAAAAEESATGKTVKEQGKTGE